MSQSLTATRSAALLDILTHYETYSEIRGFRKLGAFDQYGPPFTAESKTQSTAPALQSLLSKFILEVPGLKDVPKEFWTVQIHSIIELFEKANLSESYDKGSVGSRKTLATAVSALIEYPVRGTFGGFAEVDDPEDKYDLQSGDDIARGFRNFVDQCIYGTVLEDLVKKAAETDKLEDHSNLIKAVHEFVLVNLASFMHFTLILSPKGQYILKLVDNANKLIPYLAIRQTLKIGNIATMMSGLVKIILAKMSVASLTNWIGLTATEDDGMNLLQQVVSTVLNWDIKDLEGRVARIEKDKKCPNKETLSALNKYTTAGMKKQEELRNHSQTSSLSIVFTILADAGKPSDMKEDTHKLALEYLACKLSIRDRNEIIKIGCHNHPDHLTTMVRSLFTAYEPIIRHFHNAVDLSDTLSDFQACITDMLKIARIPPPGKDGNTTVPSIGDFIQLLRRHQHASHKFIHQLCKNGGEVTRWYLDWAKTSASHFKRETSAFQDASEDQSSDAQNSNYEHESPKDAGDLTEPLNDLFSKLPAETRSQILPVLDQTGKFIDEMHQSSRHRLSDVLHSVPTSTSQSAVQKVRLSRNPLSRTTSRTTSRATSPTRPATPNALDTQAQTSKSPTSASHKNASEIPQVSSDPGPGAFLARWQELLESTPVTPLTAHGKPLRASDKEVVERSATDADGGKTVEFESGSKPLDASKVKPNIAGGGTDAEKVVKKPDVKIVVDAMGKDFRKLLAERSLNW